MPSKETLDVKKQQISEISTIFKNSGVFIFEYRGMKVKELEVLRNRLRPLGGHVKVIKNRLVLKYFQEKNVKVGRDVFFGPLAVAYADKSFIDVAKIMVDFEKENPKVLLKAGFIEQTYADKERVKSVAKLPAKEQLLAQLVMSISMPLRKMGIALSAPLRDTMILMNNLKDKKEKEEK